jgi:hypothetical protein
MSNSLFDDLFDRHVMPDHGSVFAEEASNAVGDEAPSGAPTLPEAPRLDRQHLFAHSEHDFPFGERPFRELLEALEAIAKGQSLAEGAHLASGVGDLFGA